MAEIREIPTDIMDSLGKCFPSSSGSDTLARIIFFITDALAEGEAQPIRSLQAVIKSPDVFKRDAEGMANDTKAEKDPKYRQLMYDVWNNFLKDNLSPDPSAGQQWALAIPRDALNATTQFAFLRAVSRLSPEAFSGLHGIVGNMPGPLARSTQRALTTARSAKPLARVCLFAVSLAYGIIQNIRRWWKGEITGKRCVKYIIDNNAGFAAGLCGVIGGEALCATIGGALAGPAGMAFGGFAGGLIGGATAAPKAQALCDRLTQWIFGLPKTEALEHAYNFLGVSPEATNSEINSRYRHLSLKYHPDKGGKDDDWTRLQYSMAVIRQARGEA